MSENEDKFHHVINGTHNSLMQLCERGRFSFRSPSYPPLPYTPTPHGRPPTLLNLYTPTYAHSKTSTPHTPTPPHTYTLSSGPSPPTHPTHPHPTLLHPWDPYPHIPILPHSLRTHPHSPTPKHTHTPLPHSPVSHILVSMEREVPALGGCLRHRPTEKKEQRPI